MALPSEVYAIVDLTMKDVVMNKPDGRLTSTAQHRKKAYFRARGKPPTPFQ